jgi:hypothetical protein
VLSEELNGKIKDEGDFAEIQGLSGVEGSVGYQTLDKMRQVCKPRK